MNKFAKIYLESIQSRPSQKVAFRGALPWLAGAAGLGAAAGTGIGSRETRESQREYGSRIQAGQNAGLFSPGLKELNYPTKDLNKEIRRGAQMEDMYNTNLKDPEFRKKFQGSGMSPIQIQKILGGDTFNHYHKLRDSAAVLGEAQGARREVINRNQAVLGGVGAAVAGGGYLAGRYLRANPGTISNVLKKVFPYKLVRTPGAGGGAPAPVSAGSLVGAGLAGGAGAGGAAYGLSRLWGGNGE